nr:protein Skeletor, isoforms D/E-like [Drosophila bipectinata]
MPLTQKTIGLSEFLRPPQNAPLFHPVKLPGRRPFPAPIKKVPASRPAVLPQQHPHPVILQQPSLIVSHYRKPVPGLLKPFVKEKPFPLQPLAASVLLLGQPTELGGIEAGPKPKSKLKIPVPYSDLEPQGSIKNNAFLNHKGKGNHMSGASPPPTSSPVAVTTREPPELVKRIPLKEPSLEEIASMKPAVNHGFKPDTVIVESGFRPIMRTDGTGVQLPKEIIDQVAHRREDPGTEIDEVMETDTLFLTAQNGGGETQSFEPMFIPSPLDSTNASKMLENSNGNKVSPTASALRLPTAALEHTLPSDPQFKKPTLEELLDDEFEADLKAEVAYDPERERLSDEKVEDTNTNHTTDSTSTTRSPDAGFLADLFGPDAVDEELYVDEMEQEADDRIASAAERIDTYYLPPDNRKIPHASLPSGALYTFDGKSVVDSSLVLPPKLDAPNVRQSFGITALEQLVRTTPQFGAYRGELPEEFRATDPPQSVTDFSRPVPFSRGPVSSTTGFPGTSIYPYSSTGAATDTSPSSLSSSPLSSTSLRPISTKLHLLKANGNSANA